MKPKSSYGYQFLTQSLGEQDEMEEIIESSFVKKVMAMSDKSRSVLSPQDRKKFTHEQFKPHARKIVKKNSCHD